VHVVTRVHTWFPVELEYNASDMNNTTLLLLLLLFHNVSLICENLTVRKGRTNLMRRQFVYDRVPDPVDIHVVWRLRRICVLELAVSNLGQYISNPD